jgi:teichuronic acid biosynthesis glycosyltransferase TuaG
MPYYNAAKYIKDTVKAIIAQTYEDWELIIVDDCSPAPETAEVLQEVESMDSRIKVIEAEVNGGAGAARNLGISAAHGQYLAFCDSDDWWYPTKLEEQLKFMEENNYPFTCTWYEDADENLNPYYTMRQESKQSYKQMLSGCNVGTPGVMIDLSVLGKKQMPSLRRAEDWGLWMLYLRDTDYLYTYPKALWKYRHISGSETSNKWKMLKSVVDMYQQVLGMSAFSAWFMSVCIFLPKNIIKKLKKKF